MTKVQDKVTTWMLFECDGKARWSSTNEDWDGVTCDFSGCNCGSKARKIATTTDRITASDWFKRPVTIERTKP